jgi:hypothetical protein
MVGPFRKRGKSIQFDENDPRQPLRVQLESAALLAITLTEV